MRVAVFARDDAACELLGPLAARGCCVLGVGCPGEGGAPCPKFARRCVDHGFNFVNFGDASVAVSVVDNFKPELLVCSLALSPGGPPAAFTSAACPKKYVTHAGLEMTASPWPEFAPIFLGRESSCVKLVDAGKSEVVVAAVSVNVAPMDTAVSLRLKHAEAGVRLFASVLDGTATASPGTKEEAAVDEAAPASISISWGEAKVDRFVRARYMPPHDPAVVADPANEEDTYLIENLEQYREFCARVLTDKAAASAGRRDNNGQPSGYAADTHWYSNVGGTILKMGDSDIFMPVKTSDKKRRMVIPGAALGGRKKLRMNEPLIGPNAERYCAAALDSSWIGVEGPYVKQFEKELSRICGCSAACAVQSGTAALYGAMKALGVSSSMHHVLVPAFTCAAAADAVVHAGGLPVPVDCELDSYGVCFEAVKLALETDPEIVGVCVAPCYGVPARDMPRIYALCRERGLWICEDACESYGAVQGRMPSQDGVGTSQVPVGSMATLCVISVRSEKMVGVGEGGAILGNDATLVAQAKWWCSRAPCRGVGLWRVYEHDAVGQNFRLTEMLAAVGCAAAEMLPVMIERKRAIHDWYANGFAARRELQGVRLQKCAEEDQPVWWITAALLPKGLSGEEVGLRLMKDHPDVEIRPGFFPLDQMSIFKSKWCKPCPNTAIVYSRLVCLPSSNQLTKEDVERVCEALEKAIRAVQEA